MWERSRIWIRDNRNIGQTALAVLASLLVLLLYVSLSTKGTYEFSERKGFAKYDDLAESFLAGQLSLKAEVDPRRLRSPFPLDPRLPYPFLFDRIIFDGKYYFQHEPFPAVLHAAWIWATGLPCPSGVPVALSAWGVFLLLGILLLYVKRRYYPESPIWIVWWTWISFALTSVQMYVAVRPVVYNEAIAVGMLFVFSGVVLLAFAFGDDRRSMRLFILAGLCFGIAVACRITYAIHCAVFLAICAAFAFSRHSSPSVDLRRMVAFSAPIAIVALVLMTYNHFRFGDLMDFGREYLIFPMAGQYLYHVLLEAPFLSWEHLPHNLFTYFASLPDLRFQSLDGFPWGVPQLVFPWFALETQGLFLRREMVVSLFIMCPILPLILPTPFLWRTYWNNGNFVRIAAFCCFSSFAMFLFLLCFVSANARYIYDFLPLLFVPIFVNALTLWNKYSHRLSLKIIAIGALALLFVANAFVGLQLGMVAMSQ